MKSLIAQFVEESRDFLQVISDTLLQLEQNSSNQLVIDELFRAVHTLKGNSGLFDFPVMTQLLHAGEDVMVRVRNGELEFDSSLADTLLKVSDLVADMLDQVELDQPFNNEIVKLSNELTQILRKYLSVAADEVLASPSNSPKSSELGKVFLDEHDLEYISSSSRQTIWKLSRESGLRTVDYRPDENAFFSGCDPLNMIFKMPGRQFHQVIPSWTGDTLEQFDCYECQLSFFTITTAHYDELSSYFVYELENVSIQELERLCIVPAYFPNLSGELLEILEHQLKELDKDGSTCTHEAFEIYNPINDDESLTKEWWLLLQAEPISVKKSWLEAVISAEPALFYAACKEMRRRPDDPSINNGIPDAQTKFIIQLLKTQDAILNEKYASPISRGQFDSVLNTLLALEASLTEFIEIPRIPVVSEDLSSNSAALRKWIELTISLISQPNSLSSTADSLGNAVDAEFKERKSDKQLSRVLKVDQSKVDSLMSLVGEMVVSKNALPYLSKKAEEMEVHSDIIRDIKNHYENVNRIVEELQDAVMQIRMMPVSVIFSRFDRLTRDIAKKLNKKVKFVKSGEETEADKNIIEALNDPLVHIIRNSLDHGIESAEERLKCGKSDVAHLCVRAYSKVDVVVIEVEDDGRGIDPERIKEKAIKNQLIDRETANQMSDQEAIDLIFAPGFSTADSISDLSGRGVGMDVVKSSIQAAGGEVSLESQVGIGTKLTLKLPLSMAVSNIMLVECQSQLFGVPMEMVNETVRINLRQIKTVKQQKTAMLRGELIPLYELHGLLGLPTEVLTNENQEYAVLIISVNQEKIGIIVDCFRNVIDAILKPLPGCLSGLSCYSGTTLLGDGSVLMVVDVRGLEL